jgi:hypothetical protein
VALRRIKSVVVVLVLVALAGCSGRPDDPSRDPSTRPFAGCDQVACAGELDGGDRYQIRLPKVWNGTLLLYSHGYRSADPMPPDYRPASTAADVAPSNAVAERLLASGYALAAAAQTRNGWTVRDSLAAADRLYSLFQSQVGVPARVYVWGDSVGGLVSQLLAERRSWVSGADLMCGMLAGTNLNQDLALDAAFAVKVLLYPDARLTGYPSPDAARATYREAARRVEAAASAGGEQLARVLLAAAVVGAPEQSASHDGRTTESRVAAVVENLLAALATGIIGRPDLEQRAGGNPSTNVGSNYPARVSTAKQDEIALLSEAPVPAVAEALDELVNAPRVRADAAARAAADRLGNPAGTLRVPTVTLHTTIDPLAVPANERVFTDLVTRASARTSDLVQLFTRPPSSYRSTAPYGAGHCAFTTWERVGSVLALDRWVKTGEQPSVRELAVLLAGPDRKTGFIPAYRPERWPALTTE